MANADIKDLVKTQDAQMDNTEAKVNELLTQVFQTRPQSAYRDLETVKLILLMLQDQSNVGSLTNLTDVHIEDISDAEALNCLFDNELIDIKISSFKTHRRSLTKEPQSLLNILGNAVGIIEAPEKKGLLNSIRNKFG